MTGVGASPMSSAARYRGRRDEHAMAGFIETAELGRDLSVLAGE